MGFLKKKYNMNPYFDHIFNFLQNNFSQFAENLLDNKFPLIKNGLLAWRPHVDLTETEKEYILKVDIPGVDRKDLRVELTNDILTIQGERRSEKKKEDNHYHRIERYYGKFARSFNMPSDIIDHQKIEAKFDNGVLTVILKKKPGTSKKSKDISKTIQIK